MNLKDSDRYTSWSSNGHGSGRPNKDCYTQLAKYEDTGFTPEELQTLKENILWSRAFAPTITKERFEEICLAESEGRLLVLPVKIGDVIWICDYAIMSNRMIPIQTRINSFVEIINLMFSDKRWFTTLEDAWKYLDDFYKDDEK